MLLLRLIQWLDAIPTCRRRHVDDSGCSKPSTFWTDGYPPGDDGIHFYCSLECCDADGCDSSDWYDDHWEHFRDLRAAVPAPGAERYDALQLEYTALPRRYHQSELPPAFAADYAAALDVCWALMSDDEQCQAEKRWCS